MNKDTVRSFWNLLAPFHRTFVIFLFVTLLFEGVQMAESYTVSLVISLVTLNVPHWVFAVFIGGFFLFRELSVRIDNFLDWFIISRHAYPLYKHLKLGAVAQFLSLDMKWHTQNMSGALIGKISNGVEKSNQILNDFSWEFVPTILQTIISLIPLVFLSPLTAVMCVIAFVGFMKLSIDGNRARQKYREPRHDLYETEWHQSIQDIQSIEMAMMFGQQSRVLSEHTKLHDEIVRLGVDEGHLAIYVYNRWRIRILSLCRTLIWAFFIVQLLDGSLSLALLVFVNTLVERLFHSYWRFAKLFDRIEESAESIKRLVSVMEVTPSVHDEGAHAGCPKEVSIELKGVTFSYNPENEQNGGAIHNLTLSIPAKKIVALVGPSGAGKTTMRKILARLYEIQSGQILVNGIDIKEWSMPALRSLFSYVPQGDDVHIHAKTIEENIAYPIPEATHEEIENAAKLAGIHEFIMSLPDGYKTLLGERGQKLSGGQKQRVALARAILANRPFVIFDEATSAVDSITEAEIQENLPAILGGKTAIIIAHRLSTVWNIADKIVVMDHGEKVEEGTHEQLMARHGLYAHMASLQLSA